MDSNVAVGVAVIVLLALCLVMQRVAIHHASESSTSAGSAGAPHVNAVFVPPQAKMDGGLHRRRRRTRHGISPPIVYRKNSTPTAEKSPHRQAREALVLDSDASACDQKGAGPGDGVLLELQQYRRKLDERLAMRFRGKIQSQVPMECELSQQVHGLKSENEDLKRQLNISQGRLEAMTLKYIHITLRCNDAEAILARQQEQIVSMQAENEQQFRHRRLNRFERNCG